MPYSISFIKPAHCVTDNICIGCGRNADELKNWINFSDETKRTIKLQLQDRLEEILVKISKQKE
jgi:predicted Fe-S protein YdhL (DUF1289 family)